MTTHVPRVISQELLWCLDAMLRSLVAKVGSKWDTDINLVRLSTPQYNICFTDIMTILPVAIPTFRIKPDLLEGKFLWLRCPKRRDDSKKSGT